MKPHQVRKRLTLLETSGVKALITEALVLCNSLQNNQHDVEYYKGVIQLLEKSYKEMLPKKEPVVRNVDLEDSIIECLKEKENK